MKELDKLVKLVFSVYSNPGVYSILIGSGVSRSAKIPTGWEIMLDLIKKIAALEGYKEIKNPEKWYREKYGHPTYSKLLSKLSNTEEERKSILKDYFEPSSKDIEEGNKLPTAAHKAIAKLIQQDYIKLVITTNFDHLIEKALEETGFSNYQIVFNTSQIKGMTPYVHNRLTILKLHGDYLEKGMKNTTEELSKYSRKLEHLLKEIFDRFGLIVCGWSAEYDIALRESLSKRKSRRYSTYWIDLNKPKDHASTLINLLEAEFIQDSADNFFEKLYEKISIMEKIKEEHPISSEITIEQTKQYLSEEKYIIKLRDLVTNEVNNVLYDLKENFFGVDPQRNLEKLLSYCHNSMKILLRIISLISYYGKKPYSHLLDLIIKKFVFKFQYNTERFPALFILYTSGISSLAGRNFGNLLSILSSKVKYRSEVSLLIKEIAIDDRMNAVMERYIPEKYRGAYTPVCSFLEEKLKDILKEQISSEDEIIFYFDTFEYILGLSYLWLTNKNPEEVEKTGATTYGCFTWRCLDIEDSYIGDFLKEIENESSFGDFFTVGFFNGSLTLFEAYNGIYKAKIESFKEAHHIGW